MLTWIVHLYALSYKHVQGVATCTTLDETLFLILKLIAHDAAALQRGFLRF